MLSINLSLSTCFVRFIALVEIIVNVPFLSRVAIILNVPFLSRLGKDMRQKVVLRSSPTSLINATVWKRQKQVAV